MGAPVHAPGEQVSCWPIAAAPASVGADVLVGAAGGLASVRKARIEGAATSV